MALSASPIFTGTLSAAAIASTSSSAHAFAVGPAGATNPSFNVDSSSGADAVGVNIKSGTTAGGVSIAVISPTTNDNLRIDAKGSGTITIAGVSTGSVTIGTALTYGGVTLSNAVTGTGNMVLSASPTFTGTLTAAATAFSNQVNGPKAALTDASSIAWNLATAQAASVTLGGNRTLAAPTNMVDGGTYMLRVKQDATGSRTLAYNAVFKFPGGTAPTLSTAANALDILTFTSDGTSMFGVAQKAFS